MKLKAFLCSRKPACALLLAEHGLQPEQQIAKIVQSNSLKYVIIHHNALDITPAVMQSYVFTRSQVKKIFILTMADQANATLQAFIKQEIFPCRRYVFLVFDPSNYNAWFSQCKLSVFHSFSIRVDNDISAQKQTLLSLHGYDNNLQRALTHVKNYDELKVTSQLCAARLIQTNKVDRTISSIFEAVAFCKEYAHCANGGDDFDKVVDILKMFKNNSVIRYLFSNPPQAQSLEVQFQWYDTYSQMDSVGYNNNMKAVYIVSNAWLSSRRKWNYLVKAVDKPLLTKKSQPFIKSPNSNNSNNNNNNKNTSHKEQSYKEVLALSSMLLCAQYTAFELSEMFFYTPSIKEVFTQKTMHIVDPLVVDHLTERLQPFKRFPEQQDTSPPPPQTTTKRKFVDENTTN